MIALCAAFDGPLVSTSANLAGLSAVRTLDALHPALLARLDGVFEGQTGDRNRPTPIRDALSGDSLRSSARNRLNPDALPAPPRFPQSPAATQDARMHPASPTSCFLLMLVMALPMVEPRAQVAEPVNHSVTRPVTIYRCTDAKGYLTLRDSPCNKGERQETRSMLRPKDAPLRPQSSLPPPLASVTTPPPQIIIVNTPRPLYECVSPDNTRYLSETPEGNARWVPLWPHPYPQPYPYPGQVTQYEPGRLNVRVDNGRVSGSYDSGGTRVLVPTYSEFGGGTWVRDPCHALPQAEVCARLVDQRDVLRRRFTIAQASERAVLGREERSIGARLAQDCR